MRELGEVTIVKYLDFGEYFLRTFSDDNTFLTASIAIRPFWLSYAVKDGAAGD
jgi:hypothetical protein